MCSHLLSNFREFCPLGATYYRHPAQVLKFLDPQLWALMILGDISLNFKIEKSLNFFKKYTVLTLCRTLQLLTPSIKPKCSETRHYTGMASSL